MKTVDMYKDYLVSEQKSNKTIQAYLSNVNQMLSIVNKPENEIKFIDFTNWKKELSDIAPASMNQKIASVKNYFKWLKSMDLISENIAKEINNVKHYEVNKHDYIPMEKAKQLIQHGKNSRDKAIIATFLATGIRADELINLTMDDYVNKDYCDIMAKGKVVRRIVWTDDCKKYINEYLCNRKNTDINNLFVSDQGTKMCEVSMLKTIKNIAKRAGFEENICLHSLRHSCISYIAKKTNVSTAQHFVNHSDIKITQKYLHDTENEIKDAANLISL